MRQSNSSNSPGRLPQDHDTFPIHLIGLTQPHGVLMVLEASTFTITHISDNTATHIGSDAQTLVGQNLLELTAPLTSRQELRHSLENCSGYPSYQPITISAFRETKQFDGLLHRVYSSIILELEPTHQQTAIELIALNSCIERSFSHLRSLDDMADFLQTVATEIQALTGFDRVMVYQFDKNYAGSVVAEVKPPEEVSYLGLHYPATDIPDIARRLYCQNIIRFIPDLTAASVEIVTTDESSIPIDLSRSILRGVDPCCIEYHRNMGVKALLVIALIRENQLWGLISCHHPTRRFLSYPVRSACVTLAQLVAAEIAGKVDRKELEYLNNLRAIQTDFLDSIAKATDFKQALVDPAPRLLDVVSAQGAAICLDQDITLIGKTPTLQQVQALISWSLEKTSPEIFHTPCLPKVYPPAADFQSVASGLIVLTISKLRRYVILWFRPEVLQTVNWAGNPHESMGESDSGQTVLSPRKSFENWQETVRATALPWKSTELANALALKNAIVGIVLNKADELAQINLELERSNRELDSFAYAASHDLKEPLRGITNFSNLILRRYSDSLDAVAVKRLQTLVKLAERMDGLIDALLRFSRLGQAELQRQPTDLNTLLSKVIETLQAAQYGNPPVIHIPRRLPVVSADPTLLSEVFSNLLSNALKYTNKAQPTIEIGYEKLDESTLANSVESGALIYVKDDGIGIQERHFQNIFRLFKRLHERDSYGGGTGVGLTIAKKIIERHGGHIWVESTHGSGTTFYFVLDFEKNNKL